MVKRIRKRRHRNSYPERNLSYVMSQGGRTRRQKYLREMKAFPIPLIFSISIQTLFYGILTVQAGNHYWKDIAQVIILLALESDSKLIFIDFEPLRLAWLCAGWRRSEAMHLKMRWLPPSLWQDGGSGPARRRFAQQPTAGR